MAHMIMLTMRINKRKRTNATTKIVITKKKEKKETNNKTRTPNAMRLDSHRDSFFLSFALKIPQKYT